MKIDRSELGGCTLNMGWMPSWPERLRRAWRALFPVMPGALVSIYWEPESSMISVGPGGSISTEGGGHIIIGPGCVIRERAGGGFVIVMPGEKHAPGASDDAA